jgi:hypothetical protein
MSGYMVFVFRVLMNLMMRLKIVVMLSSLIHFETDAFRFRVVGQHGLQPVPGSNYFIAVFGKAE